MTSATEPRLVRPPRTNWPTVYDGRGQYVVGGANVSMATEKRKARVAQIQLFSNLCDGGLKRGASGAVHLD